MTGTPAQSAQVVAFGPGGATSRRWFPQAAQPPHHPPGGVGVHEPPMLGHLDGGEQFGEPRFGARELFVAGSEGAAGDEHLPQVVRGP